MRCCWTLAFFVFSFFFLFVLAHVIDINASFNHESNFIKATKTSWNAFDSFNFDTNQFYGLFYVILPLTWLENGVRIRILFSLSLSMSLAVHLLRHFVNQCVVLTWFQVSFHINRIEATKQKWRIASIRQKTDQKTSHIMLFT